MFVAGLAMFMFVPETAYSQASLIGGGAVRKYPADWSRDWILLERAQFSTSRFMFNRDPYVTELDAKDWRGMLEMRADFRVTPFLLWENRFHTSGDDSAVKHVGWEFELRIDLFDKIQPFYYHHSQHVMEEERPGNSFPLQDRYGIRFNLYER